MFYQGSFRVCLENVEIHLKYPFNTNDTKFSFSVWCFETCERPFAAFHDFEGFFTWCCCKVLLGKRILSFKNEVKKLIPDWLSSSSGNLVPLDAVIYSSSLNFGCCVYGTWKGCNGANYKALCCHIPQKSEYYEIRVIYFEMLTLIHLDS